jgi:hypothetical protein
MNQISERVQEELNEAASHIRNALSFASRTEKPTTIRQLGSILQFIEEIPLYDKQAEATKMLQENIVKMMNGEPPQPPAF